MSKLYPGNLLIAFLSSALLIFFSIFILNPVWQIHDDVYYAMIADGYGIARNSSILIPYMHPIVGHFIGFLRSLIGDFSYAIYLYLCMYLGCVAIIYRCVTLAISKTTLLLIIIGITFLLLLPQYTTVSGFLVSSAAVLWVRNNGEPINFGELFFGAFLIFLAAIFRIEMAALTVICLASIVIYNNRQSGHRAWSNEWRIATSILLIFLAVHFSNKFLIHEEMEKFYALNNARLPLVDYGYGKIIRTINLPLPDGLSANDVDLINSWFFAEREITKPNLFKDATNWLSLKLKLKNLYWNLKSYLPSIPSSIYFWLLACVLSLLPLSKNWKPIVFSLGLLTLAWLAIAILKKPFPERIFLGIFIGFFILQLVSVGKLSIQRFSFKGFTEELMRFLHLRKIDFFLLIMGNKLNSELEKARQTFFTIFIIILLIPACWLIANDRANLKYESNKIKRSVEVFDVEQTYYVWVGGFPLRAAFRPFDVPSIIPSLVFLGSMYDVPVAVEREKSSSCGGFIKCLVSGKEIKLLTDSEKNIYLLNTLFLERYNKILLIKNKIITDSFTIFYLETTDNF